MATLPDIQARRSIEDKAAVLGTERQALEDQYSANKDRIIELLPDALDAGISFDGFAKLVSVSRQTLYRWQD